MLLVAGFLALASTPSFGAAFLVTRTDDPTPDVCAPSDCSLREAIITANAQPGPDTVALPAGIFTLSIPPNGPPDDEEGDLDISGEITVAGAGAQQTVIDGGDVDRVLEVSGVSVVISDVTIRNGQTTSGGGGISVAGVATFNRVAVMDNNAITGSSGGGGIVVSGGTASVTVTESALTSNATSDPNGSGGALLALNGASATLTNVTVSGNAAYAGGGGVYHQGPGTTSLVNVTVTGNTADADNGDLPGSGGGVNWEAGSGPLMVMNTIVGGNLGPSSDPDCSGTVTSQGNNLIQSVTSGCAVTTTTSDITGQDPKLGPLADNGGPTMTHALLSGSPAIDAGGPGGPATDQRGVPRNPDIGAYELAFCSGTVVNRVGTAGNDTLAGTSGADGVFALAGDDTIDTKEGDDRICAGEGSDTVNGASGNDTLLGESGDDVLTGAGGNDGFDGGTGTDRLMESGDVDFTLTDTSLTTLGIGSPASDSLLSIERATLSGGASANDIDASGFSGAVTVAAGEGTDGLVGSAGNDTLDGGPGLDTLFDFGNVNFTLANTSLVGVGTDAISSIEGAFLLGGPGNNVITTTGFTGSTVLFADGGRDRVVGGPGPDIILGGPGNDYLASGKGQDNLAGGRGKDRLFGGAGKDRLSGGRGGDRLSGGAGKDRLSGDQGIDVCRGTIGTDKFKACEIVQAA
ncbi:MAG TPA: choice-of-anchor Q domain-containing protein [Actinomycetota bacterium]|nr:choice-of-anchor Q domain-containing protein [Actinomycetota bacterium]